jgi:hypothetical protein
MGDGPMGAPCVEDDGLALCEVLCCFYQEFHGRLVACCLKANSKSYTWSHHSQQLESR